MPSPRRMFIIGIVGVGFLAGIVAGGAGLYSALSGSGWSPFWVTSSATTKVGSNAPDFELESLAGKTIKLSDLQGTIVVINFWATWCAPCVLEMPGLERTYEHDNSKFIVLAINAGESVNRVHQFVKDIGITFDVLFDPQGKVQRLYQVDGYPTTFILDTKGTIRVKYIGQLDEDQLAGYLKQIGIDQ